MEKIVVLTFQERVIEILEQMLAGGHSAAWSYRQLYHELGMSVYAIAEMADTTPQAVWAAIRAGDRHPQW